MRKIASTAMVVTRMEPRWSIGRGVYVGGRGDRHGCRLVACAARGVILAHGLGTQKAERRRQKEESRPPELTACLGGGFFLVLFSICLLRSRCVSVYHATRSEIAIIPTRQVHNSAY